MEGNKIDTNNTGTVCFNDPEVTSEDIQGHENYQKVINEKYEGGNVSVIEKEDDNEKKLLDNVVSYYKEPRTRKLLKEIGFGLAVVAITMKSFASLGGVEAEKEAAEAMSAENIRNIAAESAIENPEAQSGSDWYNMFKELAAEDYKQEEKDRRNNEPILPVPPSEDEDEDKNLSKGSGFDFRGGK